MTDRIEALSTGGKQVSDTDIAAELEKPWTSVAHWQVLGGQAASAIRALSVENEALREQAVTVKPLEWLERRNDALMAGPYEVCCNGSATDPDAMWRVRFHGKVVCKKIKGVDRAVEWANKHHTRRILSALDAVSVAQVRKETLEEAYNALPNEGKDTDGKDAGEGYDEAVMDARAAIRALAEKEGE
jgi:hypothetical protein